MRSKSINRTRGSLHAEIEDRRSYILFAPTSRQPMAGFRMHVGTSSVLGVGYAGVLYSMYCVPASTATVAGALCGFGGMLPDLDSDYGVPLREAMSFAAAAVPVFLVNRFESL